MNHPYLYINNSNIHGKGLFTKKFIPKNKGILLVADWNRKIYDPITTLARYVNHIKNANCKVIERNNKSYLISTKDIEPNTEITVDYTTLSKYFDRNIEGFKNNITELQVTPQGITPKKVFKYFKDNIGDNYNEFNIDSDGWKEYKELCKPYIEKYDYAFLYKLSQQELNQFYNKMRTLVRKRVGKEILSELQVKNPNNITAKEVYEFFTEELYWVISWEEYAKICEPYIKKYGMEGDIYDSIRNLEDFEKLSQPDLLSLFKKIKNLSNFRDKLSELQVTPQNITPKKVHDYFMNNIWDNHKEFGNYSDGWKEYNKLCEPYIKVKKHPNFLYKLSQPELNQFYNKLRALVRKHVGKEILNELKPYLNKKYE